MLYVTDRRCQETTCLILAVSFSLGSTACAAVFGSAGAWLAPIMLIAMDRNPLQQTAPVRIFPDKHWSVKSPKDVGLDAVKLKAFEKATKAKEGCIIRHGYLVYQWGDISIVRRFASAYKPVNSTMLLFAL